MHRPGDGSETAEAGNMQGQFERVEVHSCIFCMIDMVIMIFIDFSS